MFLSSWSLSLLISITAGLEKPVNAIFVKQALSLHSANSLNKPEKSSVGRGKGNTMYPIPSEYSQEKAEGKKTLRSHLVCPPAQRQWVSSLNLIHNEQKSNGLKDFFFPPGLTKKMLVFTSCGLKLT